MTKVFDIVDEAVVEETYVPQQEESGVAELRNNRKESAEARSPMTRRRIEMYHERNWLKRQLRYLDDADLAHD